MVSSIIRSNSRKLNAELTGSSGGISGVIGKSNGVYPEYKGDYEVAPSMSDDVILKTSNKVLKNDVKVLKMEQLVVDNTAGGSTLIIGGFANGN